MQNFNWAIEYIQNNKKTYVDLFVHNKQIAQGLHEFVDKQTELCFVITKNFDEFTKAKNILSLGNICKQ